MQPCDKCGNDTINRGRHVQCKSCGRYSPRKNWANVPLETVYEENRNGTGSVSGRIPYHMTDDEIIEYFHIDTEKWEIEKIVRTEREVYRKDRQVQWHVEDGKVKQGHVEDSGKIRIEPLIGVRVSLIEKKAERVARNIASIIIEDAKKFSPKYKKIKYRKQKDPVMLEIQMPDLQLGRMVMQEEAGVELTPDIAVQAARKSVRDLLSYAAAFPVEKILFPVGNDFFDSNTAKGETAHGTPQRDDPRWQRTYRLGKNLLIELIDEMSMIAPVNVPVIVGNHDEERMFYMGDTLSSWYHKNPNVSVDNRPIKRKYIAYGKCLIGLTHGYWEKLADLPNIMPNEVPDLWAKSLHRVFHVGDKHHNDETTSRPIPISKDFRGVHIRLLRSLASPSVWEFDKGFVGGIQAAESFIWHPDKGNVAQFIS